MPIVIGLICAASAIALFASGVFAGWKLRGIVNGVPKPTEPPPLTDEEKQRILRVREEEEAFKILQNYSTDDIYDASNGATF